ncbi:acetylornithine deacetylase [Gammaproteobacteria bacterium AS21]
MSNLSKTIELLSQLIAFDTTSRHSNLPLIEFIEQYLADLGITSTLVFNEEKSKANLIATIGPKDQAGIALSGHTDVVPAEQDGWDSPPFELHQRDGLLYGRGTCDMKGFIAAVLVLVPQWQKANLTAPIHLCFSYDEEIGCLGVHSLIDHLDTLPVKPYLAIIGEPSEMQLINGHKGKVAISCNVKGTAGHSSFAPQHVNAIEYAARCIVYISDKADQIAEQGPFDASYTVPHSTMLTTMINGGRATNITPDDCNFQFEMRHLPNHPADKVLGEIKARIDQELLPKMQKIAPQADITWRTKFAYPGMDDATNSEQFSAIKHLFPKAAGKVSYGTEGGLFSTKGAIPSVICGPGNIEQAHKRNEYVAVDQLEKCLEFLANLVDEALTEK